MKRRLLLFTSLLFLVTQAAFSQAGMWTWVKGSDTLNPTGNFGTQGAEAPTNTPPGLYEPCEWTDTAGNFWLFGGTNQDSIVNMYNTFGDLWKFNPITNNWTWMKGTGLSGADAVLGIKGVPSPNNLPPAAAYGACSWIDHQGDLWLYGGIGPGGILCDMWRYHIGTNTWTWMNGPGVPGAAPVYGIRGVEDSANTPGERCESDAIWVDSAGYLWMYGGAAGGLLFDLWRYNTATNNWACMAGNETYNVSPRYGTQGVPSYLNTPGGRQAYCTWTDANWDFWLYGGLTNNGSINDMWRYQPATGNWTWMAGGTGNSQYGGYGALCASDTGLLSSSRYEHRAHWKDDCGNFWFYGGEQQAAVSVICNDLWSFNPVSLQWTLVSGGSTYHVPNYGVLGIASPANTPGGRMGSVGWKSKSGNLYLFGGSQDGYYDTYNDVWKFIIDPSCGEPGLPVTPNLGTDTIYCTAFSRVLYAGDSNAIWSTGDTAAQITINQPGTYWAQTSGCNGVLRDSITISVQSAINPFSLGPDTIYCGSSFSRVLVSGNSNSIWSTGDTAAQITVNRQGTYWASIRNACSTVSDTVRIWQSVITLQTDSNATACGESNGAVSVSVISGTTPYNFRWNTGAITDTLSKLSAGTYMVTVTDSLGCTAVASVTVDSSLGGSVLISCLTTSFCAGDSSAICAPPGYLNYAWNIGDTGTCVEAKQSGNYYVSVTNQGGCILNSNHININVYPAISVEITVNGDTLRAFNARSYQWFRNDTLLAGETDSVYIARAAGVYTVLITDSNGCSIISNGQVITGISNLQNQLSLKLYPDPASDELNISYTLNEATTLQITLTDITGRFIKNVLHETQAGGSYLQKLNTSPLAAGVYMVNFVSGNGNLNLRFVKD